MVMLGGGNDGLNTVAPLADPLYGKARPSLAIPKEQLLKLNDAVGFHPALRRLRDLFGEGKVSVVQNVGYPGQDRSHFRSMEIWQTGQTQGVVRDGWLGRCLGCDDDSAPHSVSFGSDRGALGGRGGVLSMGARRRSTLRRTSGTAGRANDARRSGIEFRAKGRRSSCGARGRCSRRWKIRAIAQPPPNRLSGPARPGAEVHRELSGC